LATDPEARIRFPALPEKNIVGLERGPLSLVSTTEELLERKVANPVLKTENTAIGIRHAVGTLYPQKLVITSPTSGSRSVGIVRSRTQTMEFSFSLFFFFEIITQKKGRKLL
jgi:restriction endonuclease S subunit